MHFLFAEMISSHFHLGKVANFRLELAVYISFRIGIFRKNVDYFEVGAKVDLQTLLAYLGRGNLYAQASVAPREARCFYGPAWKRCVTCTTLIR